MTPESVGLPEWLRKGLSTSPNRFYEMRWRIIPRNPVRPSKASGPGCLPCSAERVFPPRIDPD